MNIKFLFFWYFCQLFIYKIKRYINCIYNMSVTKFSGFSRVNYNFFFFSQSFSKTLR